MLARSHDGKSRSTTTASTCSVKGAKLLYPPLQKPYPPVYFGGSSPAAHELAAEQVDTYLTWGEPPAAVAEKVADIRARAARHGRTLEFGIRLHVIVRETEDEAWRAADELISHLDDDTVAAAQAAVRADGFGRPAPHGRAARGRLDKAHVAPTSRSRPTCGPASAWCAAAPARRWSAIRRQVAARIEEYAALGLDNFILSGYPHLEEAYRFAELVFPLLPLELRGALPGQALTGPFGEVVANTYAPRAVAELRAHGRRA